MGQAGALVAITSCYRAPRRDTIAGKTTRDTIVGNVGGDNQRHLQLCTSPLNPLTHTPVTDTVCDTLVAKTQLASDNLKWNISTQWQNVTTSSCRGRKGGKIEKCTAARQDLVAKVQPCHHIQTKNIQTGSDYLVSKQLLDLQKRKACHGLLDLLVLYIMLC